MVKTVALTAEVTPQRQVTVALPNDVPVGWAEFVLIIAPLTSDARLSTAVKEDKVLDKALYFASPRFVHADDPTHFTPTVEEITDEH